MRFYELRRTVNSAYNPNQALTRSDGPVFVKLLTYLKSLEKNYSKRHKIGKNLSTLELSNIYKFLCEQKLYMAQNGQTYQHSNQNAHKTCYALILLFAKEHHKLLLKKAKQNIRGVNLDLIDEQVVTQNDNFIIFKYQDVIPRLKNYFRLSLHKLESIHPDELFLTDDGYMVYLEDIYREYRNNRYLANPEAFLKTNQLCNLSDRDLDKIKSQNSVFTKKLKEITCEVFSNTDFPTSLIDDIYNTGQTMRYDSSPNINAYLGRDEHYDAINPDYPPSQTALGELNHKISQYPERARNLVYNNQIFKSIIDGQLDYCRHFMGGDLIDFADDMRRAQKSITDRTKLSKKLLKGPTNIVRLSNKKRRLNYQQENKVAASCLNIL